MGNTCVGPSFGNGGFLDSVTAALWKTPAQEENKLHHANIESGGDNNSSADVLQPRGIEPNSFFPVQSKPPEPIIFTSEENKPVQIMINETKSAQIPMEMKPVQIVNGYQKRAEEVMAKPEKNENIEGVAKRKEVEKPKKPVSQIKRVSCAGLQTESVLQRKTENFKDIYSLGRKLGQGQFGTTFLCVEKATGNKYACKSISKRKMVLEEDVEDVRREIQIMHHLAGHPNVISIVGAYEDAVTVHVVMELCSGGELFDRILEKGHYSEREAAMLARVIVGVVETCHSLGVMHRDLKAENFLFVNESEDSLLKSIDFGLSVFFKPGEIFIDVVGSPYYLAPEVLRKHYGPECDVWSAGVIIYILLSGFPPFWDEVSEEIFEKILKGELDFESEPWPSISENAKDLVKKMLVRDPKKRLTSHQVLGHPWVKEDGVAPDKPLDSVVLTRLKHFAAMNRFKKIAVRIIAESLSEEEIAGLKEMFKMIDTDNSGNITLEELKNGLKKVGADLKDTEINSLMQAADIDNSGTIDYKEFVAAMLHLNKVQKEDHLYAAFSYFDKDGSGYITQDELQLACEHFGLKDTANLEDIIRDFDQDDDGRIDYNEFVAMMQDGGFGKK